MKNIREEIKQKYLKELEKLKQEKKILSDEIRELNEKDMEK